MNSTPLRIRRSWRRLVIRLFALISQAAPYTALGVLVTSVASGFAPVAAAYATKLLVDELGRGTSATASHAVMFAIAITLLGGTAVIVSYIGGYLTWQMQQKATCLAEDRLYTRVKDSIGLQQLEDPPFHDKMRFAEHAVEGAPADIIAFAVAATTQLAGIGSYLVILLRIWPPMAALLLVAAVPAFAAQVIVSRRAIDATYESETYQRRRWYYREQVMDPVVAKEIRLFGLGDLFHGRMMGALYRAFAVQQVQNRRSTAKELVSRY